MSLGWVPSLAVLAACAACGRIGFGAASGDGGGGDDDDGSGSSSGSDLSGTCLDPGYGDSFDEVFPCKAFGMVQANNGNMSITNGVLTLTPNANVATTLGCERTSGAFGAAGTFIEISQVLPPPGQTLLTITSTANGYTAGILEENGMLGFTDSGGGLVMHQYNPSADRWWRIRPSGGSMLAETSPDGKTWNKMGSISAVAPSTVAIAAYVQTDASDAAPGSAVFQGIDVCPP